LNAFVGCDEERGHATTRDDLFCDHCVVSNGEVAKHKKTVAVNLKPIVVARFQRAHCEPSIEDVFLLLALCGLLSCDQAWDLVGVTADKNTPVLPREVACLDRSSFGRGIRSESKRSRKKQNVVSQPCKHSDDLIPVVCQVAVCVEQASQQFETFAPIVGKVVASNAFFPVDIESAYKI